jgi:chromosome partitioning protein
MPSSVIAFVSSKGGVAKTTSATHLAIQLAQKGAGIIVIDADKNRHIAAWAKLPGVPPTLSVISENVDHETILDHIEEARSHAAFIIIDVAGDATPIISSAVSRADFVVIPSLASHLDSGEARRVIKMLRHQERLIGRPIPFAVLWTKTSPAIVTKEERHVLRRFAEENIPQFETKLHERAAFRAIFSFGGTLSDLDPKDVNKPGEAIENAKDFRVEIIQRLRELRHAETPERAPEPPRPALRVVEG